MISVRGVVLPAFPKWESAAASELIKSKEMNWRTSVLCF